MISKTPFIQFLFARIRKTRERLASNLWQECAPNKLNIACSSPTERHIPFETIRNKPFKSIETFPFVWGKKFHQIWFKFDFDRNQLNSFPYLRWKDQAESTLYVNGVPYAGYDPAHLYWKLPENFETLHIEATCISTGIWGVKTKLKGIQKDGSHLEKPVMAQRDDATWNALIDLEIIEELLEISLNESGYDEKALFGGFKTLPEIPRIPAFVRKLVRMTDDAIDQWEHGNPSSFADELQQIIQTFPASPVEMKAILTGHSHLDLVWLWPESTGEFKATHTFASMNRLMDQYPEFIFGFSQPAAYRSVKKRSPQLYQLILERIRENRWEATGACEVESDTNIACGEAFFRSVLLGQRGFKKLRKNESRVLWLPDVFGYAGYVPQVLKECSVDYFFTQKQSWNNATRFPYSSFKWRGIDGSEVISHVMQSSVENSGGYNGKMSLSDLREQSEVHDQASIHDEMLTPTGYGDGAGGTTERMLERARRFQNFHGTPRCEWGKIEDFYGRMEKLRDRLPVWSGEIYFEYHRGVQTTHGRLKSAFRGLERALQVREAVASINGEAPVNEKWWQRLIFAQFHDYIPGSSIMEVYEKGVPEMEKLANDILTQAYQKLNTSNHSIFNPHLQSVKISQSTEQGLQQLSIPPLSTANWSQAKLLKDVHRAKVSKNKLSNNRIQAIFNANGHIESLSVDGKKILLKPATGSLWLFPDNPVNFEAWDIDRTTLSNGQKIDSPLQQHTGDSDGSYAELAFSYRTEKGSTIKVTYSLEADQAYLKICYEIDWKDEKSLLKVAFPTEYMGQLARFGAGFGSVRREQLSGSLTADAKFEVPASRWAILPDDAEQQGLWVVTRDRYGFGARDGILHLSLLRSALITDTDQHREIRNLQYQKPCSDLHNHTIEIAIGAFDPDAPLQDLMNLKKIFK